MLRLALVHKIPAKGKSGSLPGCPVKNQCLKQPGKTYIQGVGAYINLNNGLEDPHTPNTSVPSKRTSCESEINLPFAKPLSHWRFICYS